MRRIELARSTGAGSVAPALLDALLQEAELEGMTRLRFAKSFEKIHTLNIRVLL